MIIYAVFRCSRIVVDDHSCLLNAGCYLC
jgi:hypothetical protein